MNSINSKHGFTLMEMMVVVGIFSVVMGIVYTALRLNDIYRDEVGIQIALYRKNKQAHNTICEELRLSSTGRVSINDSNPDSLRFQIPIDVDDNYYGIWGADSTADYYIQYRLNGTNLLREVLDGDLLAVSDRIIASNIIDLQFQSVSNYIQIETTVQKSTTAGRTMTLGYQSQAYLRNN